MTETMIETRPIPVIGLGAGGHAKVVIDILRLVGRYDPAGLLDPDPGIRGRDVLGVPILGGDELLAELPGKGVSRFFVGLGGVGDLEPRIKLYRAALAAGLSPVEAIHPGAIVSEAADLGPGPSIMARAVINPGVDLGENVIINTGAVVDHDCLIGDHVHIAPGAILSGGVRVNRAAHVGTGAVIRQGIRIGAGALVGSGAVVVRDLEPGAVVAGNPARLINRK